MLAAFAYLYFSHFSTMNQNWVQAWLWPHFRLVYWIRQDSNPQPFDRELSWLRGHFDTKFWLLAHCRVVRKVPKTTFWLFKKSHFLEKKNIWLKLSLWLFFNVLIIGGILWLFQGIFANFSYFLNFFTIWQISEFSKLKIKLSIRFLILTFLLFTKQRHFSIKFCSN